MKFSKRLKVTTLLTVAILGTPFVGTALNHTQSVQAAKKRKIKTFKFKKIHRQILWGPYHDKNVDLNTIGTFPTPGDNANPNEYTDYDVSSKDMWFTTLKGSSYINGKKYYYETDDNGKKYYYNPLSIKKPVLYHATSDVNLYTIVSVNNKKDSVANRALIPDIAKLKQGSIVGFFNYLKPYTVTKGYSYDNKVVNLKGKTPFKVSDGSTLTLEGGKYIEILLDNGHYTFIKASDKNKFIKGGTGKAYLNFKKVEGEEKEYAQAYNKNHKKKMVYGGLSWK